MTFTSRLLLVRLLPPAAHNARTRWYAIVAGARNGRQHLRLNMRQEAEPLAHRHVALMARRCAAAPLPYMRALDT